ncbi:hypothetical protein DAI22_07g081400 [Oryza sativa Japonica Group]|nr:hypothetical protein DAI22_07g081400 [Oryza sativa Japonica Group]
MLVIRFVNDSPPKTSGSHLSSVPLSKTLRPQSRVHEAHALVSPRRRRPSPNLLVVVGGGAATSPQRCAKEVIPTQPAIGETDKP